MRQIAVCEHVFVCRERAAAGKHEEEPFFVPIVTTHIYTHKLYKIQDRPEYNIRYTVLFVHTNASTVVSLYLVLSFASFKNRLMYKTLKQKQFFSL